jgi:nucleotide-binding universal stress UspA family protein
MGPIVIGYDGSEHARAAIDRAAALLRPGPAVVVTVWSTLEAAAPAALLALPAGVVGEAVADIDEASRTAAEAIAADGAGRASAAGFEARPEVVSGSGAVFATLVARADELDAAALVLGSRGRSTLAATLLGSVSTGVLHHTSRPVLVARAG